MCQQILSETCVFIDITYSKKFSLNPSFSNLPPIFCAPTAPCTFAIKAQFTLHRNCLLASLPPFPDYKRLGADFALLDYESPGPSTVLPHCTWLISICRMSDYSVIVASWWQITKMNKWSKKSWSLEFKGNCHNTCNSHGEKLKREDRTDLHFHEGQYMKFKFRTQQYTLIFPNLHFFMK